MGKVKVTFQVQDTLRTRFNKKAKKEKKTAAGLIRSFMKEYLKG